MKTKRLEPIAGRLPSCNSEAARADIEALRASDRLQRIFESDFRPRAQAGAGRTGSEATAAAPAGAGHRGPLSWRRARFAAGLVPVFLGLAALAAAGVSQLNNPNEPVVVAPTAAERSMQSPTGNAANAGGRPLAFAESRPKPATARRDIGRPVGVANSTVSQAPVPEPVPQVRAKASRDLGKSIDLDAAIRLGMAALRAEKGSAHLAAGQPARALAEGSRDKSVDSALTVPQPTWSPAVPSAADRSADATPDSPAAFPRAGSAGTLVQRRAEDAPAAAASAAALQQLGTVVPVRAEGPASSSAAARIVLHYRGDAGEAAALRLANMLRGRGLSDVELRRVPVEISQANVRFYYGENRPVARQVSDVLEEMGRPSDLRDFTRFAPLPARGTVEVWLPG